MIKKIQGLLDGDAILFVGSAFSRNATNRTGKGLPTGSALAEQLAISCGIPYNDDDLSQISDYFLLNKGETELVRILKENFIVSTPSPTGEEILKYPWKRVYTTNYDDNIETTCKKLGKHCISPTQNDTYEKVKNSDIACVHLNGYIHSIKPNELNQSIKLTSKSYAIEEGFNNSEWGTIFRSDIRKSSAIIFIGYSLYDLDVARVIAHRPEYINKALFIVAPDASPLEIAKLKYFGEVEPIGDDGFKAEVQNIEKDYITRDPSKKPIHTLREFKLPDSPKKANDSQSHDLLWKGQSESKFIWDDLTSAITEGRYIFNRDALDKALDLLAASPPKDILVHSMLGCGKSIFIQTLAHKLAENGITVYYYIEGTSLDEKELDLIIQEEGRTVVIIEEIFNREEVVEYLMRERGENLLLVMSSRSARYEIYYDEIELHLGDNFYTIDLTNLTDRECSSLIELFDHRNFWGELSSLSPHKKLSLIKSNCNRKLSQALLEVIKSNSIKGKIQSVLDKINNKRTFYEFIVTSLVFDFINVRCTPNTIREALGKEFFNEASFKTDAEVREIVNFNDGTIIAHSSILAEFILNSISDSKTIINLLVTISENCDKLYKSEKVYEEILRGLTQFPILQGIFPARNRISCCVEFFDRVKNLPRLNRRIYFWLHYGIARVAQREFTLAESYFDRAYALTKTHSSFDSYQLDNHYASFLLKKIDHEKPSTNDAYDAFLDAAVILSSQSHLKKVKRHLVFKRTLESSPILKFYFQKWSKEQQETVIGHLQTILEATKNIDKDVRDRDLVKRCVELLQEYIAMVVEE